MKLKLDGFTFEWDDVKAEKNLRKHNVSFDEAASVFLDASAQVYANKDHSDDEERFIIIGISYKLNLLLVCHCLRDSESTIRIISARKAEKKDLSDLKGKVV